MKMRGRPNRWKPEWWETMRLQLGEERLMELYCYSAIQRIQKVIHSGKKEEQICREITTILRDIGLD